MALEAEQLEFVVGERVGRVSALLQRPPDARLLYVLAHGAGAGMRHPFLASVARALAGRGIATLRYQFPYVEAQARRPDPPGVLEATVRTAVAAAASAAPGLPLVAGGKTPGGGGAPNPHGEQPRPARRGLVVVRPSLCPPK